MCHIPGLVLCVLSTGVNELKHMGTTVEHAHSISLSLTIRMVVHGRDDLGNQGPLLSIITCQSEICILALVFAWF